MPNIPDLYPYTYDNQIREEFQQMSSRLERCLGEVHKVSERGKRFQIGDPAEGKAAVRGFVDSTPREANYRQRWLRTSRRNPQEWIDRDDANRLGEIDDPTPSRIKNLMSVAYREKDFYLIEGLRGNAFEGDKGETPIPFNDDFVIPSDLGGDDSGINYEKYLTATTNLGAYNVTGQGVEEMSQVAYVCTHFEIADMLREDEFTNSDYSDLKRAALGQVVDYQGVTIIPVSPELLPVDATTGIRDTFMFSKSAIAFGIHCDVKTNVDIVPVKNYAILLDLFYGYGCTRIKDEGVWKMQSFRANAAQEIAAQRLPVPV